MVKKWWKKLFLLFYTDVIQKSLYYALRISYIIFYERKINKIIFLAFNFSFLDSKEDKNHEKYYDLILI